MLQLVEEECLGQLLHLLAGLSSELQAALLCSVERHQQPKVSIYSHLTTLYLLTPVTAVSIDTLLLQLTRLTTTRQL